MSTKAIPVTPTEPAGIATELGLALETRPEAPGKVAASLAFARRGLLKIRHVPEQMADAIAIPLLFTVLFTYLFGGALAGSTGTYLDYVLPGTLVMSVLLVTVYAGQILNTDISRGVFDRYRSLPVWRPALIVGTLIGEAGRHLLAATLVIALGLAMGYRPDGGVSGVLLAVGLVMVFAFSLTWVWMTLGLVLRSAVAVAMVSFVVQFPLVFASNTFVDPATMPGWLQAFVDVNPVSHLVTAERGLFNGDASLSDVAWPLAASALVVAVFAPLTLRLYNRKQ